LYHLKLGPESNLVRHCHYGTFRKRENFVLKRYGIANASIMPSLVPRALHHVNPTLEPHIVKKCHKLKTIKYLDNTHEAILNIQPNNTVKENEEVTIVCEAIGNPLPTERLFGLRLILSK